jgi:hypothetical protein
VAKLSWGLEKSNTGRNATKQDGSVDYSVAPAIATYTSVFSARYTILAAGTQAVDFYSFTDLAGNAVTATKIYGVLIVVTGAGSSVKVEPHGTNPLTWFFAGTTPSITIPGSATPGGMFLFSEGGTEVLSATVRQWLLTCAGATATVDVVAVVGA